MNVLSLLNNELKDKNWTLEEKSRYLYLRSCQLFSYDQRYLFWDQIPNGIEFLEKIRNASISLEDLQTNLVICRTHISSVLFTIFKELLNLSLNFSNGPHVYGIVFINKQEMRLDSTEYYDLFRAKLKMTTYGYHPSAESHNNTCFCNHLKEIDQSIQYITTRYYDKDLKQEVYQELKKFLLPFHSFSAYEFLLYRMKLLQTIFKRFSFSTFSDAFQCVNYLLKNIFGFDCSNVVISSLFSIKTIDDWEFATIYSWLVPSEGVYYVLHQDREKFIFEEISIQDVFHYTDSMQGTTRMLIP